MRILVTGVTGFVGRKVVEALRKDNHRVYGLIRPDKFMSAGIPDEVEPIAGDLLTTYSWSHKLSEISPDVVIHMAALTPVRKSWRDPWEFMKVNYIGTVNLYEDVSVNLPGTVFVYYSSAEVYDPPHSPVGRPLTENDRVYPRTPYAASKLAAEAFVTTMAEKMAPVIVLRPCNTFDRSELHMVDEAREYFVEKAIIKVLRGENLVFEGREYAIRTWMHVSDHAEAVRLLVRAIEKKKVGYGKPEIFNIAPPESTMSCRSMLEMILDVAESKGYPVRSREAVFLNQRPYDPPYLGIDGTKFTNFIRNALGVEWPGSDYSLRSRVSMAIDNWAKVLGVEKT
ncbi:MAG: NAD-dependent epimerase/dehydratase family protein [Nitrososphaerota archaeon]